MVSVQILLTIALVAILYAQGEIAARGALAFGYRLGGERGMEVMRLAAQAVRSVALGVVVTALVQSVLAGLALWICGIPAPGVLAALVFILGIAQLGPLLVMIPAIGWLYWTRPGGVGNRAAGARRFPSARSTTCCAPSSSVAASNYPCC